MCVVFKEVNDEYGCVILTISLFFILASMSDLLAAKYRKSLLHLDNSLKNITKKYMNLLKSTTLEKLQFFGYLLGPLEVQEVF